MPRIIYETEERHKFKILEIPFFYNGKAAIIPAIYKEKLRLIDSISYTPTIEQIIKAETILNDNILGYEESFLKGWRIENKIPIILNNIKKIEKYYRYYIGTNSSNGNTILAIYLFNYESKDAKEIFRLWKDEIVWGVTTDNGGFWNENTCIYYIDLKEGKIINSIYNNTPIKDNPIMLH